MTLLDRIRRRPRWQHFDADVRLEAVRQLGAGEQERLGEIARTDTDPRVRRAAVRRLSAAAALAAAAGDPDEGVREEAIGALLERAMGGDPAAAETSVGALSDSRHLITVARAARLAAVRQAALDRLQEPRALAAVARTAEDPAIRIEALGRVADSALLLEIASRSEHKDVAVAAVERLEDIEALRGVVERGKNKAAARRARGKLEERPGRSTAQVEEPAVSAPSALIGEEVNPEPLATPPPGSSPLPQPEAIVPETPEPPPAAETLAEPAAEPAPSPAATSEPAPERPSMGEAKAAAEGRQRRERERKERLAHLEELCARLEALTKAEALSLRATGAALRDAKAAQDLGGLPARLLQRLRAARAALFARSQELREEDEWSRWGNAAAQEELCHRVETLAGREDLEQVARELHEADARWAEVRQAPRDEAETLRQRYQAARARVKARVDAYFAQKAEAEAERVKQKEALCARAEALADSTDWLKTSEELKALQARWKEVGPVSHRRSQALWQRFRAACDRFFTRRQEDLRRRKADWAANLERKGVLCARAEALAESTDWEAAATEVRKLQAEWKTVGPVRKDKSEAVWQRFRKACDAFFERYRRRGELERAARRAERERLCVELEALLPPLGERPPAAEGLPQQVQALLAGWRQAPPLPPEDEESLSRRLAQARDRLIDAYPDSFRGTELDPAANRAKREKLCARVEGLVSAGGGGAKQNLYGEELARRLKEALAANAIGGPADSEARRRAETEEVEAAQAAWKRLGPVPGEVGAALEERFRKACARFFEERRVPPRRAPRHAPPG